MKQIAKKVVKPSPVAVIFFGAAVVFCIVISVAEFADTFSTSAGTIALDFLVIGAFIYFLLKYLSQEKIEFDDNSFTVSGKSYSYDEITDVTVNNEYVLRSYSTLRIKVFIAEEAVCSFTKDDNGGKAFIAVLKEHGATVSIDI
ncbi:MAG: hypothetical protein IIX36_06465 [Clostridia bacterium]|nr:hypothetical protein [Clostridia bacterium]